MRRATQALPAFADKVLAFLESTRKARAEDGMRLAAAAAAIPVAFSSTDADVVATMTVVVRLLDVPGEDEDEDYWPGEPA